MKWMVKSGKKFTIFKEIMQSLTDGEKTENKYRDHLLVGQYKGTRECHIEPDWLLLYETTATELVLICTGTHADLFK